MHASNYSMHTAKLVWKPIDILESNMNGNKDHRDNKRMQKKMNRVAFSAWAESLKLCAGLVDVKKCNAARFPPSNITSNTNTHTQTVSQCIIYSLHIKRYDGSSGEKTLSILMSGEESRKQWGLCLMENVEQL